MEETVAVVFLEERSGGKKDLHVLFACLLCDGKILVIKKQVTERILQ